MNGQVDAIIVDGVRYDKVKANTEFVCEECELRELCENDKGFALKCNGLINKGEMWSRHSTCVELDSLDLRNISISLYTMILDLENNEIDTLKFDESLGESFEEWLEWKRDTRNREISSLKELKDKVDDECRKQSEYERISNDIKSEISFKLMQEGKIPYKTSAYKFCFENCIESSKYALPLREIMTAYSMFCRENNEVPRSQKTLSRILQRRNIRRIATNTGTYFCIILKGEKPHTLISSL